MIQQVNICATRTIIIMHGQQWIINLLMAWPYKRNTMVFSTRHEFFSNTETFYYNDNDRQWHNILSLSPPPSHSPSLSNTNSLMHALKTLLNKSVMRSMQDGKCVHQRITILGPANKLTKTKY